MNKLITIIFAILAINTLPIGPITDLPDPASDVAKAISLSRCPEIAQGPAYYLPWFPWPKPCVLVWVWVSWYPFPPRICYVWRCRYVFGNYVFYFYYKYCRRLWWRANWTLNSSATSVANFNFKDESLNSDTFSASSVLNDVLEDQRIDPSVKVNCNYSTNLAQQISKQELPQTY